MKKTTVYILAAALLAGGCAKTVTTSDNSRTQRYLDRWAEDQYGVQATPPGFYILEEEAGTGESYAGQTYAFVDYDLSDMSGTINSTTDPDKARRLRKFNAALYFGPRVWTISQTTITAGLEAALKGMRIGGRRKVLIPSWLMGYQRYDDPARYLADSPSGTATSIYDITLRGLTDDIVKHEIDACEDYTLKTYASKDSLSYGFYYHELKAPKNTREFPSDTTVWINYTGRRLDGSVFDTTIERVAKDADIYSPLRDYSPVKVVWGADADNITFYLSDDGSASTPIEGFRRLLWEMRAYGRSEGIFISQLGYGTSGSQNAGGQSIIPAYCPLRFEVELVAKP